MQERRPGGGAQLAPRARRVAEQATRRAALRGNGRTWSASCYTQSA